jgi:PIN domain nuclease of toxin-antitoxin system
MSSRLLLDTHVALWSLSAPGKLRAAVRRDIERGEVFVSAASIWEIAIKSAVGKLKADPRAVLDELPVAGFDLLPISGLHAARTADLGVPHKDPFDRMLLAQALCESMVLLTNDEALAGLRQVVRLV